MIKEHFNWVRGEIMLKTDEGRRGGRRKAVEKKLRLSIFLGLIVSLSLSVYLIGGNYSTLRRRSSTS